ncbi:MAG: ABC transporter permease [Actinomycetota bacterium]
MTRYLIRRSIQLLFTLWVTSVLTFLVFVKLPPGDPAIRLAGKAPRPEVLAAIRERIGLNDPLLEQYARFAKGLVPLPGWFLNEQVYYSWRNKVVVKDELARRAPYTAVLALGGIVLWLLIGIPLGILSAVRRGSFADRITMFFALIGISMPSFWLGMVLIFIFYFQLGVAPPTGVEIGGDVWDTLFAGKFVLGWFSVAITSAAYYARLVRGNMLEVQSEDYVRTARAKGLSERKVIVRHQMRSSLTPVVTTLGLDIAALLGGLPITERVFSIPGIGLYALESLNRADFPAVMAVTIISALLIIFANLFVDILYAVLDPRVRYS